MLPRLSKKDMEILDASVKGGKFLSVDVNGQPVARIFRRFSYPTGCFQALNL